MSAELIRTLIVDDEGLARRGLRRLLEEESDVRVHGEYDNGEDALAHVNSEAIDLVFLDVRMPVLDGFGVLDRLPCSDRPLVIFSTAYSEYARRAFDVRALDYVVKPIEPDRLRDSLSRVRERLATRRLAHYDARLEALLARHDSPRDGGTESELTSSVPHAEEQSRSRESKAEGRIAAERRRRFAVRTDDGVRLIAEGDIDWIEAAGYYAKLHVDKGVVMVRESFNALERRLDAGQFTRIHRSAIVNLDRVATIRPYFHGRSIVVLHDGTRLVLSRTRRTGLAQALGIRL